MMEQLTLLDVPSVEKLSIKTVNEVSTIYWKEHYALVSYRDEEDLSKRLAIVFLIQTKLASYAEVASLLGYSEANLYVIMRSYREQGVLGLVKKKTGPKDTKVTADIQRDILQTKGLTLNKMVEHIQKNYGVSLSNWTISAVKRGKIHQEQFDLFPDEMLDSLLIHNEQNDEPLEAAAELDMEQISFQPENEPIEEVLEPSPQNGEHGEVMEIISETIDFPQVKGEHMDGDRTSSRYAGGFLLLPFLNQINPAGLFQHVQEAFGIPSENAITKAYNLTDFMYTLIFLLWFRFSSIEDFKFVQPREFGVLIDKERAPSVKTLRRYFPTVLDGEIIDEWMLELVRQYIKLDVIELGTLYFDGHKIPYYGHVDLPKGYLSSKRFPAKLIEQVFANDRSGRPIFLRVHDTSLSFRDTIVSMIQDAQDLWEENDVGKQSPLIVAFDRELYDTDLFKKLDERNVMYITWRKYDKPVPSDKLKEEIRENVKDDLDASLEQPSIQYRAWRRGITVQKYKVEAISFLSEQKAMKDPERRPSTLVTNAGKFYESEAFPEYEPPSTGEIIDILCQRWRQENYFRYSKHGERLDYNPKYQKVERQEVRTQANLEIRQEKQAVKEMKKEIDKLNDKMASRLTKRKKKDIPLQNVLDQKSMKKLIEEKEEKEQQLQSIREKISTLPERIPVENGDSDSWELELQGKRFLDVLRIVMHNAEQMLLDIFKRCYANPRDIHKVLRGIATQGGTVIEHGDAIVVELSALPIPAHRRAAEQLCHELNVAQYNINGKTIYYKIKNSPS